MADGANPFDEFAPGAVTVAPGQSAHTRYVSTITGPVDNQGRPLLPLIHRLEGSGDQAVSPKGAVGRNQIMPATARLFGFDPARLSNPAYNDVVAAAILTHLDQVYHGDLDPILISYNSTPGRAARFLASGGDPSTLLPETQKYLQHAHQILGGAGADNPFAGFSPDQAPATPAPTPAPAPNPFAEFAPPDAANPFAQFVPQPPVHKGGTGGFADAVQRLWNSAIGGAEAGTANLISGAGHLGDVYAQTQAQGAAETGAIYDPITGVSVPVPEATRPSYAAIAANRTPIASPITQPIAAGLAKTAAATAPPNRSTAESIAYGAGQFVPPLAAGFVDPLAAPAVFGAQGFEQAHQEALNAGASEDVAQRAGLESGGIQAGLGALPVGEVAEVGARALGASGIGAFGAHVLGQGALGGALQTGSNIVAQENYDPARTWDQGVPEAALDMGIAGAAIHAGGIAYAGARNAIRARLTPRADVATATPDTMPATTALADYIGHPPEPSNAEPQSEPGEHSLWTPEREARYQAWAREQPGYSSPSEAPENVPPAVAPPVETSAPGGLEGVRSARAAIQEAIDFYVKNDADDMIPRLVELDDAVREGRIPASEVEERLTLGRDPMQPLSAPAVPPAARDMLEGLHPADIANAAADVDEWKAAAPRGYSLFQAIKDLGGIAVKDENGVPYGGADVQAALSDVRRPGLINKTGLSPEYMMQALSDRGWFGPEGTTDPTDFENLLDQEAHGQKVYNPEADTAKQLARRDMLDHDMALAGVLRRDDPALAAAKLARYRQDAQAAQSPEGHALDMRAEELGVPRTAIEPQDELLADVLEREAIQGEATHDDYNAYERSLNLQLTDRDRQQLEELARTGPGAESYAGAPAEPLPAGWESEPGVPEAYREPVAGPDGDREGPREGAPQAGRELATERMNLGGETVEQGVMPGMEPSARQAAAARAGPLRARVDQESPGTLFEPHPDDNPFALFDPTRDPNKPRFQRAGSPLFNRGKGSPEPSLPSIMQAMRLDSPTAREQGIIDNVEALLAKIAPMAEARAMAAIRDGDAVVHGAAWRDGLRHVIGWSLEAPDAIHIARHEALHTLISAGVVTPDEWNTLANAALSEGWMDRYRIEQRYPDLTRAQQIEEAVAERFGQWRRDSVSSLPPALAAVFKRIALALQQVGDALRRAFGRDATADDVFSRIESGEVGKRPIGSAVGRADVLQARAGTPEEQRTRNVFNRILGSGAESVGRKLQAKTEAAIPEPVADLLDAVKTGVSPMGMGSERGQAAAKDFANALRATAFQWGKVDEWLTKTFTPEQRQRMWSAADEHGVILRQGREPGENEGKNRLEPAERAAVEEIQSRADAAFKIAQDLGMVQGDGLESYVPRMIVRMTISGPKIVSRATPRQIERGGNLSTTTGQLRQRKYETVEETEAAAKTAFGETTQVVRDIRTLALGTQRLEQAIAGRTLVGKIKDMSAQGGGADLVTEGANPDDNLYFTLDHPALQKWGPKFITTPEGKTVPVIDQNGDTVFEAKPLYVSREFEGPLKAVLSTRTSGIFRALLDLKGKMLSIVMYSPLIHNAVIWGKAIPADPVGVLTLGAYFKGHSAKLDPKTMSEAIQAGMDPIGHRFFNQDITGIAAAEGQDIAPGRSWTAQLLAYVPSLFDKEASNEVKRFVDKAGDVWHNTFLWDRIADLQAGLYVHFRDHLIAAGEDPLSAQRMAAHFANRYAGALPMETLSKAARTTANLVLFSRSFTLGNVALFKDVVMGLPSDVRAQILRDAGRTGLDNIQGVARQKAAGMLALDVALSFIGLNLAALAVSWLTGEKFQPTYQNEPGKTQRFLIGYQQDGTAIYGRLPTGKVGEELWDWPTDFRDTLLRKLSPYGRLMYALAANDKGFGHKLTDPYDHTPLGIAKNIGRILSFAAAGIAPETQLQAIHDAVVGGKGLDRKTATLGAIGPAFGLTISRGAAGGPAMADIYQVKDEQQFRWQEARADVFRQIKSGDLAGARARMTELGVSPGLQKYYIRTAINPASRLSKRALQDFMLSANAEERARLPTDRAAEAARAQAAP